MSLKVRLPNGRYIKVNTEDPEYAKQQAVDYYKSGKRGFVDGTTKELGTQFDKRFDYESGVDATWLRTKLGAMETLGGKENVLTNAVGSKGFTRDSKGNLALTPDGLRTMGIIPKDNKNVVIDESGFSWNDFADFAGIAGPIAGSIAGSIITRGKIKPKIAGIKTMSLLDLAKVSGGTGLGATAGKGVEEGFEYMSGLQDNSPDELVRIAAGEFAIGAGAEFGLGAAGKLLKHTFGNRVLSRYAKEDPTNQVGRNILLEASAGAKGLYDPVTGKTYKGAVALAGLESPIVGRLQPILETVSGYKGRQDALSNMLLTDLKNVYRSTNDLSTSFNSSFDELKKLGFSDVEADVVAGKLLKESFENSFNKSEKLAKVAQENLDQSVNRILGNFDAFADPASLERGAAIRSFTEQAYDSWKNTSNDLYKPLRAFFTVPIKGQYQVAKNESIEQISEKTGFSIKELIELNPKTPLEAIKEGDIVIIPRLIGKEYESLPKELLEESIPFLDSSTINTYAQLLKRQLSAAVDEDAIILKELDSLMNLGGSNKVISVDEILKIREDIAGKVRIQAGGTAPKFADLKDFERTRFLKVIDNILKDAENGGSITLALLKNTGRKDLTGDDALKNISEYMKGIRLANKFYSKGLQSFDRPITKKIFNDAESGGWNMDKVLDRILVKNNGEELKRYLDTLDASTAGLSKTLIEGTKKVARAQPPKRVPLGFDANEVSLLKNLDIKVDEPSFMFRDQATKTLQKEFIRRIVKLTSAPSDKINYTKIANKIDSYGTTGDILFGSSAKKQQLVRALKEVDNLSGTETAKQFDDLITEAAGSDEILNALRNKVVTTEDIASVKNIGVFKKIQNGTIDAEEIVESIFKPANSEEIIKVKNLLGGENTEAFKMFQQSAMRKILDNVISPGEDAVTKLFDEGGFATALNNYGDAVLKETFGDEQFKLLMKAKDRMQFFVGSERRAGGGGLFTQGFIFKFIFEPLQAARVFAPMQAMAYLLGRPGFVKWLAGEVSDKQMLKTAPTLLNQMGAMGVVAPLIKPLGQVIPRAIGAGEDEAREFAENPSRISPEATLLDAKPELEQSRVGKATLELPQLLPPLPNRTTGMNRTSATLLPNPIDRDLALLLNRSNP